MNPKKYYNKIAKPRHKKQPWKRLLRSINNRCYNPNCNDYKWYNGRNIENKLTVDDIKFLMKRDNYYGLKNPTIDRIDNDGDYELSNCRFIENELNSKKDKCKPVLQHDLYGNFIKEWESQSEASRTLNISQGNIGSCCRGLRRKASGFIWKHKT